jgi:DNA modification methylase
MSPALAVQHWPVEKLIPFATNARTHSDEQIAQIAASIAEFGFVNPVLVGPDGIIIAGHARLLAARKLGLTEVPVIVLGHLSKTQRRALALADNRLPLNAGWDDELLRLELEALREEDFNLDLLGFSDEEMESLLAESDEPAAGLTDEDEAPEAPEQPVSLGGDLWLLGSHRLLVGDATNVEEVARLMGNERADLVFTDLPYNIDYHGRTAERLTIANDRMSPEEFVVFLEAAFGALRTAVKPTASIYVCHGSRYQREFQNALEAAGFEVRCQIIWAKHTFSLGWGRYRFQHEPIFYCHVAGEEDPWYGDHSQSTLWQEKKPAANRLHPTMKPVELVERALVNSSRRDDVVADLFGGSGSTLIACERLGRQARLMEIDPRYADVIIRRWTEFAGKAAVLESDGRTFEEVAAERGKEKKAPPIDQATVADNA